MRDGRCFREPYGSGTDCYGETCLQCGGKGVVDEHGFYVEDDDE